jgi:hypothetical protein
LQVTEWLDFKREQVKALEHSVEQLNERIEELVFGPAEADGESSPSSPASGLHGFGFGSVKSEKAGEVQETGTLSPRKQRERRVDDLTPEERISMERAANDAQYFASIY